MLESTTLPGARTLSDLPSPRGLPVVGNLLQIDLEQFHVRLERWSDEFGPMFTFRMGGKQIVCVSDTTVINDMLRARPHTWRRVRSIESVTEEMHVKGVFSAEGDEWKLQRKIVAMALNSAHIQRFFPRLEQTTRRLLGRWYRLADEATAVELCRDLMRYTVDVTTQLAFGIDVNTIETDGPVVQQHLDKVFPMLHKRINAPFPFWRYVRLPSDRALDRALAEIEKIVTAIIVECRERMQANPELYEAPTNFLEAIIAAQASESGAEFTDEQIYANVLTLLLAGEDTTANTIAWACKYLIEHPDYFARARAEADLVMGDRTVIDDAALLKRLTFIDAIVQETMRLKPVGPIFALEANEDLEILGCEIPKGTTVFGLTRHIAIDPENFGTPGRFDPDRWLEAGERSGCPHNAEAFMPFGTGPRFCPGRNLALTEIKMVLAMLCRNFDLRFANPAVPVEEKLAFAMMPKNLDVVFKRRS